MRWRPIRRADLSRCLDVQPACLGDRIVGHQTALRVWHDLLEHPGFHGTVIESALSSPYSAAAALYRYREPVRRLRPAEQALLTAALDGETDAELSARLGRSLQATKKRWLSVFARVSQFKPDVLIESQSDGESVARPSIAVRTPSISAAVGGGVPRESATRRTPPRPRHHQGPARRSCSR
jgi:hypothetical protein